MNFLYMMSYIHELERTLDHIKIMWKCYHNKNGKTYIS